MAIGGTAAALRHDPLSLPQSPPAVERLRLIALWLTGATGAVVFIEPSPYELASLLAMALFLATGLPLRAALLPLAAMLVAINVGYTLSAASLLYQREVLTWVATSWYLAATALLFAAALGARTQARLDALMRGCLIAGVIGALAGIAGYFRLAPGSGELFLLYDRARGLFKDPNVYGAFMVLPALLVLQRVIAGQLREAATNAMLLALFSVAILLSFSRAAWGQLVLGGILVLVLTFVTTRSPAQRLRIVLLAFSGIIAIGLLLAALSSVDAVAELLQERMSLQQSYDVGEQGRFGRHALGALLALERPNGIGPLQFSRYFPEDPHNTYLNAFVSGGWLAGMGVIVLTLLSLIYGLRAAIAQTPWRPTAIVVYSAYVGVMVESIVIDSDHWRHAFLLLGVLWGLIAATPRPGTAPVAGQALCVAERPTTHRRHGA